MVLVPIAQAQSRQESRESSEPEPSGGEIEGSWRVVVTRPTGEIEPAMETYVKGGGYVQSSFNDALQSDGSGHGAWIKTGHHEYTATFEKFVKFNFITHQPGVFKIKETVWVDDDNYTGIAVASLCDKFGKQCVPLDPPCATTVGKRMTVEEPQCP